MSLLQEEWTSMKTPWLKGWSYPGLLPSNLTLLAQKESVFRVLVHLQASRFHLSWDKCKTWLTSLISLLTFKGVPLPIVP